MKITFTELSGVLILEPRVFEDVRGVFFEAYNRREMEKAGISADFVQDNESTSRRNVLRGLHYQIRQPQGKMVHAVRGEIFDVVVDCRRASPTFGKSIHVNLSEAKRNILWVPPGFAHGFLALSEVAHVAYKATDFYAPEFERTILWNDAELSIPWPCKEPIVSDKDRMGRRLAEAELFE